jgi:protein transport protein SEC61 subunit gamma-like protein
MMQKAKGFLMQCRRVWQILRKPSSDEFKSIAKVSTLGLLILGASGFIISQIIGFVR